MKPGSVHNAGRTGIATTSDLLEGWHRYTVPAFIERLRTRVKTQCDDTHTPGPPAAATPATSTSRRTGCAPTVPT